MKAVKQQPVAAVWSAGVRKAARRKQTGRVNGGPSRTQPRLDRRARARRLINRRAGLRGAHEAIVSEDPAGQHNPLASQGPLDWSTLARGPDIIAPLGYRGTVQGG